MAAHAQHLSAIGGVDGAVDIGGVATKLLEQAARLDAMDTNQAIEGGAQDVGAITRQAHRRDALCVGSVKAPEALPCAHLPYLHISKIDCQGLVLQCLNW